MKQVYILAISLLFMAPINSEIQAQQTASAPFKLCTGRDDGNYFKAAYIFRKKTSNIEPITSAGSIDNLDKIQSGACDGAFVQVDALLVYSARNAKAISSLERAGILYSEDAHLFCNRNSGINRVVDLTKQNRIAFVTGGAKVTWDAFIIADRKRYEPVGQDTDRTGIRALTAVADGSEVQCALYVGAQKSSLIKDDAEKLGDRIVLVDTDDRDMTRTAKDARGKSIYTYGEIQPDTYPTLQPKGMLYGTKKINTITVEAVFVVNSAWIKAHEQDYEKLLRAFAEAKPEIATIIQAK